MGEAVKITVPDGAFSAYLAQPTQSEAPAIVVLHELFGVNSDIRQTCDELAERGYIALSPDLFWRQEPGLDLSHWTEAEWEKGLALYNAYDHKKGVSDIAHAIASARSLPGASGKAGVMGFCLGGLMTFLTAASRNGDAAVAYYPGGAENHLDKAGNITIPLMIHLGDEDEFISKDAQERIKSAFAEIKNVEIYSYPGCSHAFARHTGTHYDPTAAATANNRTWAFFDRHLK